MHLQDLKEHQFSMYVSLGEHGMRAMLDQEKYMLEHTDEVFGVLLHT
jgi:hypothetical protein